MTDGTIIDNMGKVYGILLVLGGLYTLLLEFAERRWRLVDQVTFIWVIAGTLIVVLTMGTMVTGISWETTLAYLLAFAAFGLPISIHSMWHIGERQRQLLNILGEPNDQTAPPTDQSQSGRRRTYPTPRNDDRYNPHCTAHCTRNQ